jgi:hypothetical protein
MMDGDFEFTITCSDCGESFNPREEVAEDHDDDCPVYESLVNQGRTRQRRGDDGDR